MIRYIVFPVLLFLSNRSIAQVTEENRYSSLRTFQVVSLEGETQKFMLVDSATYNVLLFNDNHTLWKRINTTLSWGSTFAGIGCISTKLFNMDSDVELSFSYYAVGAPTTYATEIWNEKGSIVQTLYGIGGLYPITINGKTKVIGTKVSSKETIVYSVPGKMAYITTPSPGTTTTPEATLFPNPMGSAATLRYTLPAGVREASLAIYDITGHEVRRYTVTDHFSDILINRGELPSGMYVYKLITASGETVGEGFVVE